MEGYRFTKEYFRSFILQSFILFLEFRQGFKSAEKVVKYQKKV
jgi:hypothetical protein